ncbi:hypothetical protein [Cupriavidus sp. amp6]|uniref:hypothetical protein n=1 Tax=Cupriavidus sp. amp6 TaxID=388051 RepID=UPI0012EBA9F6|nr:hypothetical protein [Cupriavidus sp. amp6]
MSKSPSFTSSLYWSLPGPSGFVRRLATSVHDARAIALSLPKRDVVGLWDQVNEALERAHIEKRVNLNVNDDTHLEAEIALQFGRGVLTASQLAQFIAGENAAVVLRPKGERAAQRCERYFAEFFKALPDSAGNVRLLFGIRDGSIQEDGRSGGAHVLAFDGGLSPAEMQAYVGIRTIENSGPGSTTLRTALICEYAGYDVQLAEQLISMADEEIYCLPNNLGQLLEADPLRWSRDGWADGNVRKEGERTFVHPLREWYLAHHEGPKRQAMEASLRQRCWRACVKALTPWLEERRADVMRVLSRPLDSLQEASGGQLTRKMNDRIFVIEREQVEYNNIVAMERYGGLVIPPDERSQLAFMICQRAKKVRDELAHLRPPLMADVLDLISSMDALLETAPQATAARRTA